MIHSRSNVTRHLLLLAAGAASVCLGAPRARAAGIGVDVQSARAMAMGAGAVTGMIDDSSAIYYNPAGIAQGQILDAQVGDSFIMPSSTYESPSGVSTTTPFAVVPPFYGYAAGGITRDLSVGVGMFTPYGLTIKWPAGWEGRSLITYANLASYDINPTIAYRFGPVRVGAGLQVVYSTVDLQRDIALPNGAFGTSELGGDGWGVGGNVGLQVEAVPKILSFGLHYRSAVAIDYSGNAHFGGIPATLAGTIHDQAATTRVVLPDSFAAGIAVRPTPKLVLDADVVYYGWSHLQSIDIAFPNDASGSLAIHEPKNWSSTVNFHLGGEFAFNDMWSARAGAVVDPTPSPDETTTPDLPDSTRVAFCLGGGYRHPSGFRVDLAYELVVLLSRTSTQPQLPGTYSGFANIVGLTVGYTFGAHPKK